MFTLCDAKKLLTPEKREYLSWTSRTHGGIKVYCTGNPNNLRDYPLQILLTGSKRARPVDYVDVGKRYWGKHTKTCAVYVDGDSAHISHLREELLIKLSHIDNNCKEITGVDLLMGTVYVQGKNKIHKYPISKYREVFYLYKEDYLTLRKGYTYFQRALTERNTLVSFECRTRRLYNVLNR